jgi:hypothetical protein
VNRTLVALRMPSMLRRAFLIVVAMAMISAASAWAPPDPARGF